MNTKRILLIVLAMITLFSSTVPAAAVSFSKNITPDTAYSVITPGITPEGSSVTVPLMFDGSKPDQSDVVVENVPEATMMKAFSLFSAGSGANVVAVDDGLPKRVENVMLPASTSGTAITVVTADRYFLYTPQGSEQPRRQFMAEFKGETAGEIANGYYYARLAATDSTSPEVGIQGSIVKNGDESFVFSPDLSNIIGEGQNPATIYLSIMQRSFDGMSADSVLYGPVAINVNYVNDSSSVSSDYRYIRNDLLDFYLNLRIPGQINTDQGIDISLVNSSGDVVAKSVKERNDSVNINYGPAMVDDRYNSVFNAYYPFNTNKTEISTWLYRAADMTPGCYSVKLSVNGGDPTTYPNLVQIVDGPIISGLYAEKDGGYPPPIVGGNQTYIVANIEGADKDDFSVLIIDSQDNVVGSTIASKYYGSTTYIYKIVLNDGLTFQKDESYSIKLVYHGTGNLYFSGSESEKLNASDKFKLYDYSFYSDRLKAAFNLKAVNIPTEVEFVELGLFNGSDDCIATATVAPSEVMTNVQFVDEVTGSPVTLEPYAGYSIRVWNTDFSFWEYMLYIFTLVDYTYTEEEQYIYRNSLPYIYTNDSTYNFEFLLPKDINNISESTTFSVRLKNANGDVIGSEVNIVKEDVLIGEDSTPGVQLSGILSIPDGILSEGIYDLVVDITGTAGKSSLTTEIFAISKDKIFATSSYPEIEATETGYKINGYAYMLKKDLPYDMSKFTYELKDLSGNLIAVGPLEVTQGERDMWYQDYYEINAPIVDNISPAYYYLKLKYDGKDIYDLYDPSELIFSGYNAVESIPIEPDCFISIYNGGCSSIALYGAFDESAEITAMIYDSEDKENFTPVKTVALTQDASYKEDYYFTEENLSGLEANKKYDITFFYNGNFLGSINDKAITIQNSEVTPVTGVTLDQDTMSISINEAKKLDATVEPAYAGNKNVTWSSSDSAIAEVDQNGLVTGKAAGTATITVTTVDGGFSTQCIVTVVPNIASIALTKLAYEDGSEITSVNGTYEIDGVKYPFDGSKPLSISIKGDKFTADKEYSYTITMNNNLWDISGNATGAELASGIVVELPRDAELIDGTYTCTIAVKDNATQVASTSFTLNITGTPIPVTGVTLKRQNLTMAAGNTAGLTATVAPSNATNKKVLWSSSDESIVTVDANTGVITAVGAGSATITVKTEDGEKTTSCAVNVTVNVSGTLMAGSAPVLNTWLALYNGSGLFIASTYTDKDGKFSFANVKAGDYRLSAYSPDVSYKNLISPFTILPGDTSKDLSSVNFESKYENRATLTVNVNDLAQNLPITTDFSVYVYNYETGVSRSINSSTNTPGIVTVADLPYTAEGTNYYVSLYTGEATDYYYDSKLINITVVNPTALFTVPVTYKITGAVKATDNTAIQYTSVKAVSNDNKVYWGYTDANGAYVIRGLSNGTYSISVEDQKYKPIAPVSVTINNASITTGADITVQKGLALMGKATKNGVPAYKAYVVLYDEQNNFVTGGYSTGVDGFVFDGAIKNAGIYKLIVSGVYNQNLTWQNFVSSTVEINVTSENMTAGRLVVDATYNDPTNASDIFTGTGNMVLPSVNLVRSGSTVDLVIKYKNNGNTSANADFAVNLPSGVTAISGSTTFSVNGLAAGASGKQSLTLAIGDVGNANTLTIPVKVKIGDTTYDFASASLDVANITLNGPEAVKSTDSFKVYGEATANSAITIKNAVTGQVLGTAMPNGRWYSVEIAALSEGTYTIVAEATNSGVTAISKILTVESKADQIAIEKVITSSSGSSDLPVNKLIGVRAFTAWVGPNLDGRDIGIGTGFGNDSSITGVIYHFADKNYTAAKDSNGIWNANITGWSGAGLKTITATVSTSDHRVLTFIIAEVTILIDPSGHISDSETDDRLSNVTVVCEVLNGTIWEKWDAEKYGQINPQITDDDGNYGWMVPAGTYRVKAFKDGYNAYSTMDDPLFSDAGNSTIIIPPVRTDVIFKLTPSVLVTGISLNTTTAAITVGNTQTLVATVTPDDATNASNIKWITSNTSVATVSNGVVTAVSAGTATITATVGSFSAACNITVSGTSNPPDVSGENPGTVYVPTVADTKPVITADSTGKAVVKASQLQNAESLTIKGESTLTFDKKATAALKALSGDITITINKADITATKEIKAKVGDRPVYEFIVTAGGKEISTFNGGSVKVEIPYTLKKDEDLNALVIYYIDANGKLNVVSNCVYDQEKKLLTFMATHFSTYAVGYNKTEFDDVSGWATDAITFLAARGIISGVGNNKYAPLNNITRGDFAVILAKIVGADLDKYSTSRFSDVAASDRYSKAIEWAAENGIVSGAGNGKYAPSAFITRQDMAVMITKLAKVMNYSLPQTAAAINFADQNSISSYASDAAKAVQMAGIINGKARAGKSAYYFAPQDNATREEAAQILATLLKGMAK